MTYEIRNNVKYYLRKDQYYIVGDNSTTEANGITSKSYYGEIVIPEKYKKKEIREIGQSAFLNCISITRVTIFAKLTSINKCAFNLCNNLVYINIPQTVTFIGYLAFGIRSSKHMIFEFNKGRTKKLSFGMSVFMGCQNISIIYPSSIEPKFDDDTFMGATVIVCAYSSFNFGDECETTTDMSKCPTSFIELYNSLEKERCLTCKSKLRINVPLISLIILIAARSFLSIKEEDIRHFDF